MIDNLMPELGNEMFPPLTICAPNKKTNNKDILDIKCLRCSNYYPFPDGKDDYLSHLFLEHRLVIADVDDIALLQSYLIIWQSKLEGHMLEEYCTTMLVDQMPDGSRGKNEKYYLLSDMLPMDYEIRNNLWQKRLGAILSQHQFERTDRNFSKDCLYCRDVISGLRSEYLQHLSTKHFLQLGKPENLVFVDELLDKVQANLENFICIFCEKIFKDRTTLKEHMRKKGHKRINPNNRSYDKYFLQSYRTKNNKQMTTIENKRGHETRNTEMRKEKIFQNGSKGNNTIGLENRFDGHIDDDTDSDWSDWICEQLPALKCLFCFHEESLFKSLKAHMLQNHGFDFDSQVKGLTFYQKVKIVNYVRRQIQLLRCTNCDVCFESENILLKHMKNESHFSVGIQKQWDKPEYYFPTYEDDGVLCVLDENLNDDQLEDIAVKIFSEDSNVKINKDAEKLSLEKFDFSGIGI